MAHARPRLRPLELFPVEIDGRELICLRDPTGLAPGAAVVPRAAAMLAVLFDGTREVAEIVAELRRRSGIAVSEAHVVQLIAELDQALFLEGPRLTARRGEILAEWHARPHREPIHAGGAYAGDPAELVRVLDEHRAQVAGETIPPLRAERSAPAALLAPHIDFHRGAAMYARAYRALPQAPPELVIVFGTDHNGADHPFTLTRKRFATPLGEVPTDVTLVDALAACVGDRASLFADELNHRAEHSIELQAVWLRHLYGEATPPILPILCGSLHRAIEKEVSPCADPRVPELLGLLREVVATRRVLVIAGADLAHVGPRFGDAPVRAEGRREVERADEAALSAVVAGDAEGFFGAVAAESDRYRVCGLAPIYHTLALAGGPQRTGRLLGYEQCRADDDGTSFVSIAAATLG